MSLTSKIGRLFGFEDEPDDDMELDDDSKGVGDYDDQAFVSKKASKKDGKILNVNATTQLEVVLVKPERFDDASSIADHLNNRRTVVLNLESTEKNVSRRLVDFLSGVAYANDGQIKRVANSTFIITPYNVGIMGDLLDELESSGVYF
ncbi:MAG: cell division protein SepF [Oscillospiraceae bacterium]|nr:cell division protein SepF [Oscillospiraceae bacterium]